MPLPRIAITPGEPAGVGPELVARLAASTLAADLIAIGDPALLERAARRAGITLNWREDDGQPLEQRQPGSLRMLPLPLRVEEQPGRLDPRNAFYVLSTLAHAADGCLAGRYDALVTGPVHKGVINDSGEAFSGHTEFFAQRANAEVVMMLMSDTLRVALATTHLPLSAVPAAINAAGLERVIRITHHALKHRFGIAAPRLAVLGLNPHAGEAGHLGREELDLIEPLLERLRDDGLLLPGPWPADTAFTPARRAEYDAVLAMYHDQALPVLKAEAFDRAINITLGLPFIRTSVDHGTALDLAGSGRASPASLVAAAAWALRLAAHRPSVAK
ncbi:MAG TPA: 4-hydroxythreonine-4-phosphate dehydrogenase PdxA [Rhodanobacteraceae bacterium]|nr:4-hydroxythreonine-4-phosphate dehydrogenase PdxA [Rhodanobacteraceae bacterium]